VAEQVAKPLGLDVETAAAGVLELFEDHLRNALLGQILGQGYTPENYVLLSYGGGGPLHVGGYSDRLAFDDILIPAWAPGFSAFGCACGDYEYRLDKTLDLPLLPDADDSVREGICEAVTEAWAALKDQVAAEFEKSEVGAEAITFKPGVRMLYYGQLNSLEVISESDRLESAADLQRICDAFEDLYTRIYGLGAKTPQFGYMITGVMLFGATEIEKPELPTEELLAPDAWQKNGALKTTRSIYYGGEWMDAQIIDLEKLPAGSEIAGPAVVESPASTMLVQPGRSVRLDEHRIFHMSVRTAKDLTLAA
jgi:N-methylhydantoinase A/oxoprolinase/acetone carboxylase beta subunit